jgi:hypothetical protein
MKKALVFLFLSAVFVGTCFAQVAAIDKAIIGEWTGTGAEGNWTFNADGTIQGTTGNDTYTHVYGMSTATGKIYVTGGKHFMGSGDVFFSPDGKRLYLIFSRGGIMGIFDRYNLIKK